METKSLNASFLTFLRQSPGCFHAVENIGSRLQAQGFQRLKETEPWTLQPGGNYFVTRNGSSVIAFRLPAGTPRRLRLSAAHCDSPTFKIKPGQTLTDGGLTRLNVEQYGGAIRQSWLDRPLSVAGRVLVEDKDTLRQVLVAPDRDLLLIPSLAIHFTAPEQEAPSVQNQLLPVLTAEGNEAAMDDLLRLCGVDPDTVRGMDLFLTCREEPRIWGLKEEFLSGPRLDDLACCFGALEGFLEAEAKEDALLYCAFDNEEVGSVSRQGAASTFLRDTLDRLFDHWNAAAEQRHAILARSVLVSADNAHAYHPGYPSAADPVNRPRLGGGIVLKHQAAQKYTTDAVTAAICRTLCKRHGIPLQEYTNHSDQRGGSTLANLSNTQVSLRAMDIGLPQFAMHSAYETMGAADLAGLVRFIRVFCIDELPEILD